MVALCPCLLELDVIRVVVFLLYQLVLLKRQDLLRTHILTLFRRLLHCCALRFGQGRLLEICVQVIRI